MHSEYKKINFMVTFRNNNNLEEIVLKDMISFKSNADRPKYGSNFSKNDNFQRKSQVEIIIMHQN